MNDRFQIVGARPLPEAVPTKNRHSLRGKPVASAMILSLIVLGCLFCELIKGCFMYASYASATGH